MYRLELLKQEFGNDGCPKCPKCSENICPKTTCPKTNFKLPPDSQRVTLDQAIQGIIVFLEYFLWYLKGMLVDPTSVPCGITNFFAFEEL